MNRKQKFITYIVVFAIVLSNITNTLSYGDVGYSLLSPQSNFNSMSEENENTIYVKDELEYAKLKLEFSQQSEDLYLKILMDKVKTSEISAHFVKNLLIEYVETMRKHQRQKRVICKLEETPSDVKTRDFRFIDILKWLNIEEIAKLSESSEYKSAMTPFCLTTFESVWFWIMKNFLDRVGYEGFSFKADLEDAEILIIGPGDSGLDFRLFVNLFPNVRTIHVIDIMEEPFVRIDNMIGEMLEAKEKNILFPEVKGYKCSVLDLPEELMGKMDLVFCVNVFDPLFFNARYFEQALKEMTKVLKQRGVLAFNTLDFYDYYGNLRMIKENLSLVEVEKTQNFRIMIKREELRIERIDRSSVIEKEEIEVITQNLTDRIKWYGRKVNMENKNIIIGIDTSWIPECQMGYIAKMIETLKTFLMKNKIKNVSIVREKSVDLVGAIISGYYDILLSSDIIILGEKEILHHSNLLPSA